MNNKFLAGVIFAAAAGLWSQSHATPIPVGTTPADDLIINFDLPSPPYTITGVTFFYNGLGAGELAIIDGFTALNGTSLVFSSPSTGPSNSDTLTASFFTDPGFSDGQFSFGLRMSNGATDLTSSLAFAVNAAGELITINGSVVTVVPEPATFALLGIGLAGLGFSRRKQ